MVVWSGSRVAKFVKTPPQIKINPNGVDLKVSEVWLIEGNSILCGELRECKKSLLKPDSNGFYNLSRGVYEIRIANKVSIPRNAVGKMYPRSSLNRLGLIKSDTAIWEPGYSGYGTQTVYVPIKLFRIHKDEFWFQFTLEDCEPAHIAYNGHWQGEQPKEFKSTKPTD